MASAKEKGVPNNQKLCTLCGVAWRERQRQTCFTCGIANILYRQFGTGQMQGSAAVNKEIKAGRLSPAWHYHCVDCNRQAADWDHRDYNKPLDVVPVCHSCNLLRGPAIPKRLTFSEFWEIVKKKSERRLLTIADFEPIRRKYFKEQA